MMPELRPEAVGLVEKVKDFIDSEVRPKEHVFHEQINVGKDRWSSYPSVIDELKEKARAKGLWNLFYRRVNLEQAYPIMNMLILQKKWENLISLLRL